MDELRKQILAQRREFAKTDKYTEANRKICACICEMPEFRAARSVMFYLPLAGEADVTALCSPDKNFYVPVTRGVTITPARFTPDMPMKKGEYGVMEPNDPEYADKAELDFIIVPAVAVDRSGSRMGFGKGCYDRFLADVSCPTAAVCFDIQVVSTLEAKPHDIRPDYIITEGGCIYGKY